MSLTSCPNEIIYSITDHLEDFEDFRSLRNTDIGKFGHPLNHSIRKTFAHHDDYSMGALFWGAATQDEELVRLVLEKSSSAFAVRIDAVCDEEMENHGENEKEEAPHYFTLGKKPSTETIRRILHSGPNLLIARCSSVLPPADDQDLFEESALTYAIKKGSLPKLKQLLHLGTDPNLENSFCCTAFDAMVAYRPLFMEEMLKLLHAQEADLYFRGKSGEDLDPAFVGRGGNTLIHLAAICSDPVTMVETVLSVGVDINARNAKKETALHLAFSHDRTPPELVKLLIENGADCSSTPIHMTDSFEWTPRIKKKIAVFIENMEDDYRGEGGDTLLHIALRSYMAMNYVDRLLERDLDVNAWSGESQTALHIAAFQGDGEMINLLLKHGAAVMSRDSDGCMWAGLSCEDVSPMLLPTVRRCFIPATVVDDHKDETTPWLTTDGW